MSAQNLPCVTNLLRVFAAQLKTIKKMIEIVVNNSSSDDLIKNFYKIVQILLEKERTLEFTIRLYNNEQPKCSSSWQNRFWFQGS